MKYLVKFSWYASKWWAGELVPADGNLGLEIANVRYYGTWEQAMADAIERIRNDARMAAPIILSKRPMREW